MKIWLVFAVFALSILSTSSQLTTWDNQLFDFGWSPYNPTIPLCSVIPNTWNDRRTANPASTPPYTMEVYYGGYQPIVIATVNGLGYNWTVGLPKGGPYILSMKDANGYTGGDSLVFTVTDAAIGVTCPTTGMTANSLQLTSTGTNAECSELVVTATGGTAPYTMQIVGDQRPPKTTTWTTPEMSYTIDMNPSDQFFVIVTDANGLNGVEGLHTVVNGQTGCYNLATTVSAGATPTTISFDPSSTVSFPSNYTSSRNGVQTSQSVIQNTATTTVVTVVTGTDESLTTVTLPPGANVTVAAAIALTSSSSTPPLPAIIGGAVGGAVFLLFLLILFIWWRRRSAQIKQVRRQEIYDRRRLSDPPQSMPAGATYVNPYTPTPGPDTAPLMGHMSSTYSGSGVTGSAYTAYTGGPNAPPMAFAGNPTNLTTASRDEPSPAWARPAISPSSSSSYNHHGGASPQLTERSPSVISRPEGLPPGAMAPQPIVGRTHEKATFVSSRPAPAAPPPYSHGT